MPGRENTVRRILAELCDDDYYGVLFGIAVAIIGDAALARAAVHDVVVAVLERPAGLANADDPGAYLRVCVRNEARKRAARESRNRSRATELDERSIATVEQPVDASYLVDREIPANVSHRLRPVYALWRQGLTQEETSEELAMSRRTVQRRWGELLTCVKKLLSPSGNSDTKVYENLWRTNRLE